ncbi:alpha/beta family hydrolase [Alteromonas sp. KUL49]|uniref:alpha/beta family hydrolase n=1 Tax=Alteromonas sp. KUL49 TaxID=2480798 RepID=UPI00102F1635|nr:alpha/beta family hydrolase [Alteromonas sp. KUL49]TAP40300.1 alpha/beta hydrolase [Alteromonas sp. KUL49]GEA11440.1 alpha/beta hydrolase [Alteromonas sp. KUL49]
MFDTQVFTAVNPKARFVFAHGAGAGMHHDFMQQMATMLASKGTEVVLFNFPYMQTINETGKRRPPDKQQKLTDHFDALLNHIKNEKDDLPLFIGGKSMGGRMATLLADQYQTASNSLAVKGVIVFGYPFHPPGKPEKLRVSHLESLETPTLIVQGERDTFGTQTEVLGYSLSSVVNCEFMQDGDHSLKPRKASGRTLDDNLEQAATLANEFVSNHLN